MIKRLKKDLSKKFNNVFLYTEDIKIICDLFLQADEEITIKTESYIYDSFQEFIDTEKETKRIEIRTKSYINDLNLVLDREYCRLYSQGDSSDKAKASFIEISEVLSNTEKKAYKIFNTKILFPVAVVQLSSAVITIIKGDHFIPPVIYFGINGLLMIYSLCYWFKGSSNKVLIMSRYDSWWERNKNALQVAFLAVLLGFVLTVLWYFFTKNVLESKM